MNDYRAMGLPVQGAIRNISIADGSECGTKQPFSENARFVNINDKYKLSTVAFLLGLASDPASQAFDFFRPNLLGLPTLTDVKLELRITALSSQIAKEVYYIKLSIRKKILGIINIDVILLNKFFSSNATLLALDNAPGGIKDLNDEGDLGIPLQISRFCHVPTFSALDIGGGTQTITLADLTRPYSPASPPVGPKNVRVNNFATNPTVGATANEIHTQMTLRNGQWLLSEIQGTPAFLSCSYACGGTSLSPVISGPNTVCTSNAVFTLSNLVGSPSVSWSHGSNLNYVSGQGTSSYTINRNSNGNSFVSASLSGACGEVPNALQIPVRAGAYSSSDYSISGPSSLCTNQSTFYSTSNLVGATSYAWFYPGSWTNAGGQGTNSMSFITGPTPGSGAVGVRVGNLCDADGGIPSVLNITVTSCGFSLIEVSPNPVSSELSIAVVEDSANAGLSIDRIQLLDGDGTIVKDIQTTSKKIQFDTQGLPKGIYYLKASIGDEVSIFRIVIE